MGKRSQIQVPEYRKEGVGKYVLLHCLPNPAVDVAALTNDLARDLPATVSYNPERRLIEFLWEAKLLPGRVEIILGVCGKTQCSKIEFQGRQTLRATDEGVLTLQPEDAKSIFELLGVQAP